MADENTTTQGTEQETTATAGAESTGTEPEKKYTDAEMNSISKKNSEKAVNKLLKELGITDREKAKKILAQAAADEAAQQPETQFNEQVAALAASLESSQLENIMLVGGVKSEKVQRAVKLVERKDCLDESGNFSREKAAEAVKALLGEWPELAAEKAEGAKLGFTIGSDGSQNTSGSQQANQVKQKSWNRFN